MVHIDDENTLESELIRGAVAHITALCAGAAVLILQPVFAIPIALIVAYILATSAGSIIGLTYLSLNCVMDESVKRLQQCIHMKLGMNIGLLICYSTLFIQSIKFV